MRPASSAVHVSLVCIGAATSAAPLVPASTLKVMGRWSSAAYERYIRPGKEEILLAQKAMSGRNEEI